MELIKKWISKDQHCEPQCQNLTNGCFSCEEFYDCDCQLILSDQDE